MILLVNVLSDRFNEIDELFTFFLRQVTELYDGVIGIARAALVLTAVPHDSLQYVAGPAVVQTIIGTSETATQTASP